MIKAKKLLLLVLASGIILSSLLTGCGLSNVTPATIITFPDKNLEKVIRKNINKPTGDILKSDVDKITVLDAKGFLDKGSWSYITNISGIENLTNLTVLGLDGNKQISNIEPLKGLTNLTKLYLDSNKISNIEPLEGLTKLTDLSLDSNRISNIEPLKRLTNLTKLSLYSNQITDIEPLRGMDKLTELYLGSNIINDYSPVKSYYDNLKQPDFISPYVTL